MKIDFISRGIGIMLIIMTTVSVVVCPTLASDEMVLWWMFDETTKIEDVNGKDSFLINELTGRGSDSGKTVNGIRIGAYSGDELIGYLVMANDNGSGNATVFGMPSLDFDTWEDTWDAGPTYAHLGGYDSSPEVTFMIELGNWDGIDTWSILASSDPSTISQLQQFIDVSSLEMHTKLEWTGGSYSVPEPNSGILFIIGVGLLFLMRKTQKE